MVVPVHMLKLYIMRKRGLGVARLVVGLPCVKRIRCCQAGGGLTLC